jgi:hypothetical protein
MKKLVSMMIIPLMSACGDREPPLAGNMTETSICNTAGYIIRKNLGDSFKTINVKCSARALSGNSVEISSGYISPLGPTLHYTARAVVNGDQLRFEEIKVHGVDDDFIPFRNFRG